MDEVASLISTDHIQVEITIRLGRIRLSVAELGALRPDDVLPLDHEVGDGVDICIGERIVARGELVDDGSGDGRLAVRILGPAPRG
ncbi:FliM/FliN family flagellar motor switch protein [Paracoccus luteus]|uniref:FliM/FliN family flagellar motor switch protein n=1 Tax=Paracoccus luteus TaxID=2508543 RepID=UPI00107043B9|nr:FliM/FliN family flagellar motor C-terminal domain-containing protein [Paracoccus luteus]